MSSDVSRRAVIASAPLLTFAPAVLVGAQDGNAPLVVFLVRHAEKTDEGRDPKLTDTGRRRADRLASMLRDTDIDAVHSTDFIRTRDTAAPSAKRLGVDVSIYDPRDTTGLVDSLRERGGRHLVVGHSNTTPALAAALGGEPGEPIDEAMEYDRLYIITVGKAGDVSTVLLRY